MGSKNRCAYMSHRPAHANPRAHTSYRTLESTLRPSWPLRRFVARPNDGRFVHNAAFSYRPPFRPFIYHPNAARSPLKPIETASGC